MAVAVALAFCLCCGQCGTKQNFDDSLQMLAQAPDVVECFYYSVLLTFYSRFDSKCECENLLFNLVWPPPLDNVIALVQCVGSRIDYI